MYCIETCSPVILVSFHTKHYGNILTGTLYLGRRMQVRYEKPRFSLYLENDTRCDTK